MKMNDFRLNFIKYYHTYYTHLNTKISTTSKAAAGICGSPVSWFIPFLKRENGAQCLESIEVQRHLV
jgi:hypothetical protein